jgi:uncharacterized protein YndB with AHSA1/START domain
MTDHVAHAQVVVAAPAERVWAALTEKEQVREWMLGTDLDTDWKVGGPITWRGEWEGKAYADKGEVLEFEPPRRLAVTHYSPLTGQPDEPESYHTVTWDLAEGEGQTTVTLSQDGNESPEQAEQFSQNWQQMLDALKSTAESA